MRKTKKEFIKKEDIKNEIKNFKKFALKEDLIKISTAIIIGGSVNKMSNSISNNIVNPVVNFLMDKPGSLLQGYDIPLDKNFKLSMGNLFGSFFEFFLVCLLVYIIYIKLINNLLIEKEPEDTKLCPFCFKQINKLSRRCAFCTSSIKNLNQENKKVK